MTNAASSQCRVRTIILRSSFEDGCEDADGGHGVEMIANRIDPHRDLLKLVD